MAAWSRARYAETGPFPPPFSTFRIASAMGLSTRQFAVATPGILRATLIGGCLCLLTHAAHAGPPALKPPTPTPPGAVQKIPTARPWIAVGKETTRVTGPVRDDG